MVALTRSQARSLGRTHYFTGRPCKHGHVSVRNARAECLECKEAQRKTPKFLEQQKRWRANNKRRMKHNNLKRVGMSIDQYEERLAAQNHKCVICWSEIGPGKGKRSAAVDHCHSTGTVRGILCNVCNRGLGMFSDNPHLLLKASEYLRGRL